MTNYTSQCFPCVSISFGHICLSKFSICMGSFRTLNILSVSNPGSRLEQPTEPPTPTQHRTTSQQKQKTSGASFFWARAALFWRWNTEIQTPWSQCKSAHTLLAYGLHLQWPSQNDLPALYICIYACVSEGVPRWNVMPCCYYYKTWPLTLSEFTTEERPQGCRFVFLPRPVVSATAYKDFLNHFAFPNVWRHFICFWEGKKIQ